MALQSALGFAEVPFLSITALVADEMVKAAAVRLLGIETTGNPSLAIRIEGDVAAVQAALVAGERRASRLGVEIVTRCLPRPDAAMEPLVHFPNAQNPLYGGRDQFLPTDFPPTGDTSMNTQPTSAPSSEQALGILETQGLTAILEAADVMLKTANVTLVGKEKIGAAYVTVMVRGDVAAVKAAIDAGAKAVDGLGKLIAAHVIARPHSDLVALLPR